MGCITMDNNVVSKIWVGMSTTNIHLLQFKIQSHLKKKNANFECRSLELLQKKNRLQF